MILKLEKENETCGMQLLKIMIRRKNIVLIDGYEIPNCD